MLAIDIGNTYIKTAVFKNGEVADVYFTETDRCQEEKAYYSLLPGIAPAINEAVVISSVRKPVLEIIKKETSAITGNEPFVCSIKMKTGIQNEYLTCHTLGIDRIIAAAAAWHLYRNQNKPLIAVDMGTATTVDFVSAEGSFKGGIITSGLNSALKGLLLQAPELPETRIEKIERLVGRTTEECMAAGAMAAHAATVRGLCDMIAPDAVVVVTGGMAAYVSNWLKDHYIVDELLLFKGMKIIYELNVFQDGIIL